MADRATVDSIPDFENTYARDLPGLYVAWQPAAAPAPRLLFLDDALAAELGFGDAGALRGPRGAAFFSGNALPAGAEPIAQAYAGHQFGGFSPQLGDGRALLVGEVIDRSGQRRDVAFKGSGRTPFARGGDGKAAVGPMLREVLISASMHALGIPTTRALAVVATGDPVARERMLPGAVLTRVAASHLRVGTFQYVAARGDIDLLRRLADYAIARHDPALVGAPDRHLRLLRAVAARQATLVAQWMNVGFIHGVMNTDNMTISGETIDYGPCAFMEAYDPSAVFSSIDHGGRYAYANQPHIARWNVARLAEALLPLIVEADGGRPDDEDAMRRAIAEAMVVIDDFPLRYLAALRKGQRAKLGLDTAGSDRRPANRADDGRAEGGGATHDPDGDAKSDAKGDAKGDAKDGDAVAALADDWLALLHAQAVDFTLAWRRLADAAAGDAGGVRALFAAPAALDTWLERWREACARNASPGGPDPAQRAARMRRVNPWIIPRNHRVEAALAAAQDGDDLVPFERLLAALRRPWDEAPDLASFAEPAPAGFTATHRTFCGT